MLELESCRSGGCGRGSGQPEAWSRRLDQPEGVGQGRVWVVTEPCQGHSLAWVAGIGEGLPGLTRPAWPSSETVMAISLRQAEGSDWPYLVTILGQPRAWCGVPGACWGLVPAEARWGSLGQLQEPWLGSLGQLRGPWLVQPWPAEGALARCCWSLGAAGPRWEPCWGLLRPAGSCWGLLGTLLGTAGADRRGNWLGTAGADRGGNRWQSSPGHHFCQVTVLIIFPHLTPRLGLDFIQEL